MDDARRLELGGAGLGGVDLALVVEGRPSGSTRRPSSCSPTGISSSLPGALHGVALDDLVPVAEQHGADVVLLEVERQPDHVVRAARASRATCSCRLRGCGRFRRRSRARSRPRRGPLTPRPCPRSARAGCLPISSGLISIFSSVTPFAYAAVSDALSQFLEPVADARVQAPCCRPAGPGHRACPRRPCSRARPSAPGLLLDLRADPLDDLRVELDRARHRHLEPLVLLRPERVELRRMRKITGIRCFSISSSRKLTSSGSAPAIALHEPVLLLRGREVGAEEEQLHLAVRRERVGELAELLADRVELALLLRRLEQGVRVHAGDLLHRTRASSVAPRSTRGLEKSTSARASSIRRLVVVSSSDLRVTFSVVSTVRSATSLRIRSSERRVSASMSRRAAASSSSRFSRPSAAACGLGRIRGLAGAGDDVVRLLAGLA